MTPEQALERDLRRLRRAFAAFMVFIFILPWLFHYAEFSFPDDDLPRPTPEELSRVPKAKPIPNSYPLPVRWFPLPLQVIEDYIQEGYPGSLVTRKELEIVHNVAKKWNINTIYLVSIIGAEKGFLSSASNGKPFSWNKRNYHNPFSYGQCVGCPFKAYGWEASANGAASIISRVILTMPDGYWTEEMYAEFMRRLSGYYVKGDLNAYDPVWEKNVRIISTQIWNELAASKNLWADLVFEELSESEIRAFSEDIIEHSSLIERAGYKGFLDKFLQLTNGNRFAAGILKAVVQGIVEGVSLIMPRISSIPATKTPIPLVPKKPPARPAPPPIRERPAA